MTPISTGMDYLRMVIDIACGKQPDLSVVNNPSLVEIRFIISESDYNKYLSFKELHNDKIIKEGDFDQNWTESVRDSSTRHGYYIIRL